VNLRYYSKYHSGRTAFCSAIVFKKIGRAPDDFGLDFKLYDFDGDRLGTVRCQTGYRTTSERLHKFRKSLNKSADARPGTGRCFMSRTVTGVTKRVFAKVHYGINTHISLLKTKNINTKIYISHEQLRMNDMQRTSAIAFFVILSTCVFHFYHCQSQPKSFFFGLRPQTQPIYSFGIGVPKWPLFL